MQQQQQLIDQVSSFRDQLEESGFLYRDADGNYQKVEDWNGHQQLVESKKKEKAYVEQIQKENQQLNQFQPDPNRRRAMNQLEVIEQFNQNKENDLAQSMVIVNKDDSFDQLINKDDEEP